MKRAILWCGQVKQPRFRRDNFGRQYEGGDILEPYVDFKIQANDLELALGGALALGVQPDEIHVLVCREDLLPQHFAAGSSPATVAELRRVIGDMARRSTPGDALLFIAVNHGNPEGLLTSDPVNELDDGPAPLLTPDALDDCLRPLQGPQVLVIAACYAGVFLPLGARAERAVLTACASNEVYKIPREGTAWSPFLDEFFGAWCGFSLSDAIPRGRSSLDAAFERAHERLAVGCAPNLPYRTGSTEWPP